MQLQYYVLNAPGLEEHSGRLPIAVPYSETCVWAPLLSFLAQPPPNQGGHCEAPASCEIRLRRGVGGGDGGGWKKKKMAAGC